MHGLERYGIPSKRSSSERERERWNVAPLLNQMNHRCQWSGTLLCLSLSCSHRETISPHFAAVFLSIDTDLRELLNSLLTLCQHLQINLATIRSLWKNRSAGHLFSFDSVSVNQFHSRKRVLFFHLTWYFIVVFWFTSGHFQSNRIEQFEWKFMIARIQRAHSTEYYYYY